MSWLDATSTHVTNTLMATWLVKDEHLFTLFKDEHGNTFVHAHESNTVHHARPESPRTWCCWVRSVFPLRA